MNDNGFVFIENRTLRETADELPLKIHDLS